MPNLLMPKATAVWLVDNTTLTFEQIADFCGLHELEVQAIADGEVATGMVGVDPVANGQLLKEEIERCEKDPEGRMHIVEPDIPLPSSKTKGARYTPISKRNDKPDGIAWLLKNHPDLKDAQIGRLIGTTKPTINAVRDRTHWNTANIRPRHPIELGLCTRLEFDKEVQRAAKRTARAAGKKPGEDETAVEEHKTPEVGATYILSQGAAKETALAADEEAPAQAASEEKELTAEDVFGSREKSEEE